MSSKERAENRFYLSPILFHLVLFIIGIWAALKAVSPFIAKEYIEKCERVQYLFILINAVLFFALIPYAKRLKKENSWKEGAIFGLCFVGFWVLLYYLLRQ